MKESDAVRQIMESKLYYYHNPATGRYDWQKSVENIAISLNRPDLTLAIRYAIESAFTPDALTKIHPGYLRKIFNKKEQPLVAAVRDLGISPYVWTVGDLEWQKIKFINCGLSSYTDYGHFLAADENKKNLIGDWITSNHIATKNKLHFYIVDDKYSNLDEVLQKYARLAADQNIDFHPYQLKLNDRNADPTSFYQWLQNELVRYSNQERVELFMDMDGVLIDTDRVMYGEAVANISRLLYG